MNGLSFEQATRYAEWLSELTGERYRLPDHEEAESLYRPGAPEENTLDYWAGYPPNPEDAEALLRLLEGLPGEAPLLRPVGQFPGRGEDELVFDLGGNAAEWCLSSEGEGVLCGGSADRPADPTSYGGLASPPYRGMRVVRDTSP